MQIDSLHNLLFHELCDLHSAERMVADSLPKMVQAASSPELRKALQSHLDTTRRQIERLEKIFTRVGGTCPTNFVCKGMQGIISEGDEIIREVAADPKVRDAALIGAAQRVEHYEIAAYGTACSYAKQLGYNEVADMLKETLDEESRTDKQLSRVAEGGLFSTGVNEEAPKF